jgi:hypothetical protein
MLDDTDETPFDMDWIANDITVGAAAYKQLQENAGDTWNEWVKVIVGLRSLRELAFYNVGSCDMKSNAYRVEMRRLLSNPEYAVYQAINPPTRSSCYSMMEHLDEINEWYDALDDDEKLQWQHPQTIAAHCPEHLLTTAKSHTTKIANGGRLRSNPKPRKVSADAERFRLIALKAIEELGKFNAQRAVELMNELNVDPRAVARISKEQSKAQSDLITKLRATELNTGPTDFDRALMTDDAEPYFNDDIPNIGRAPAEIARVSPSL